MGNIFFKRCFKVLIKVEIEDLHAHGFEFLTDVYLPEKLRGWVNITSVKKNLLSEYDMSPLLELDNNVSQQQAPRLLDLDLDCTSADVKGPSESETDDPGPTILSVESGLCTEVREKQSIGYDRINTA